MTSINTFVMNSVSAMGSTILTALVALTTIASVARFF